MAAFVPMFLNNDAYCERIAHWPSPQVKKTTKAETEATEIKELRAEVEALKTKPVPEGKSVLDAYNEIRVRMLRRKGVDVPFGAHDLLAELDRAPA